MGTFTYLKWSHNFAATAQITIDDEDPNYPGIHAAKLPLSKPARMRGIATQQFRINLAQTEQVDFLAVLNHNLTSNATVTLYAGSVADPGGAEFSQVISWRKRHLFVKLSPARTFRYWKWILDDPTNTDGFLQVGNVLVGALPTIGFGLNWDMEFQRDYINQRSKTEFGRHYVYGLYNVARLRMTANNVSQTNADIIATLVDDLGGDLNPVFLIPDVAINEGYFGRIINGTQQRRNLLVTVPLEFEEESCGKSIVDPQPLLYNAGDSLAERGATFTRASTAYFTYGDGVFGPKANNIARDFHYAKGGDFGLLLEDASTNILTYSEEMDQAIYTKTNTSVVANAILAPDNTLTADAVIENGSNGIHGITRTTGAPANGSNQMFSFTARQGARTWVFVQTVGKDGAVRNSWVNLASGVQGIVDGGHAIRIRPGFLYNGFIGVSLFFNVGTGGGTPSVMVASATGDGNSTYTGDGASGFYTWGWQVENQSIDTSYIKTTTASAQRLAETIVFPWLSTEAPKAMTIYLRFIERGTASVASATQFSICNPLGHGPSLLIDSTGTYYRIRHSNAINDVTSALAIAPNMNDSVELRAILYENGSVQIYQSINEGAETASVVSAANALAASWSTQTGIYLASYGALAAFRGYTTMKSAKVVRGIQSRAFMRTVA